MTETRQNRDRARELSRKGWPNRDIALLLDVTERTVRNYLVGRTANPSPWTNAATGYGHSTPPARSP